MISNTNTLQINLSVFGNEYSNSVKNGTVILDLENPAITIKLLRSFQQHGVDKIQSKKFRIKLDARECETEQELLFVRFYKEAK